MSEFDVLLNATMLLLILVPGIWAFTPDGQRRARENHLSAGAAKVLGGFAVLLALVGCVGLALSLLGI